MSRILRRGLARQGAPSGALEGQVPATCGGHDPAQALAPRLEGREVPLHSLERVGVRAPQERLRVLAASPPFDDRLQLPQRESGLLESPDVLHAPEHVLGEEAVVRRAPSRDSEDPEVVVEAQRLDGHPRPAGDFADSHATLRELAHSAQQLIFSTSLKNESATIFSASAIVG